MSGQTIRSVGIPGMSGQAQRYRDGDELLMVSETLEADYHDLQISLYFRDGRLLRYCQFWLLPFTHSHVPG